MNICGRPRDAKLSKSRVIAEGKRCPPGNIAKAGLVESEAPSREKNTPAERKQCRAKVLQGALPSLRGAGP